MSEPIFSSLTGKANYQISGVLATAQQIATSNNGTITNYTKQPNNTICSCGVGNTIYYIVTW